MYKKRPLILHMVLNQGKHFWQVVQGTMTDPIIKGKCARCAAEFTLLWDDILLFHPDGPSGEELDCVLPLSESTE